MVPRCATCLVLVPVLAGGADVTLPEENFVDLDARTDLSTLISWGGRSGGSSCFATGTNGDRRAVYLTAAGTANSGYSSAVSLKTFTALDFVFPDPIAHRTVTVTVSFDARWDDAGAGEGGRFMVILMDEYPSDGVKGSDLTNFAGDPYGTPALHLRIRPGMTTLLQYGGGHGGEFEKYGTSWWLPGFIQNALPPSCDGSCANACGNATCPECCGSPGHTGSLAWPNGSWVQTTGNVCATTWKRFEYRVEPARQVLVVDGGEKVGQPLPDSRPSAPGYEYYETFAAMRLYWRGNANAYVANLSVVRSDGTGTSQVIPRAAARAPGRRKRIAHFGDDTSPGVDVAPGRRLYSLRGVRLNELPHGVVIAGE